MTKKSLGKVLVVLIVAGHLFYMKPVFKGQMFPKPQERSYLPPYHIQIPNYVFEAFAWVNNKPEQFKILLLPEEKSNNYTWGYGAAKPLVVNLTKKGVLFKQYGEGAYTPHPMDRQIKKLYKSIYEGRGQEALQLSQELGVKYYIQRNDIRYDFYEDTDSPQFIKKSLSKIPQIELVKQFGEWDIYKVPNPKPLFYTSGGEKVEYTKINPTKYKLNISKNMIGEENTRLIFAQNFDRGWELQVEGKPVPGNEISQNYANSWQLKRSGNTMVYYKPQKLFYRGLLFSLVGTGVLVALALKYEKSK